MATRKRCSRCTREVWFRQEYVDRGVTKCGRCCREIRESQIRNHAESKANSFKATDEAESKK